MPPKAHAVLSASSADRWLHCPPSARLQEMYEDKGSDYALEGTCAHALCEYNLLRALGREAEDPTENLDFYNEEMAGHAACYAAYVLELVEEAKKVCNDPAVLVEQRVDFSRWVEEGFGTADCLIIADGTLNIVDFKYGLGVLVSAEDNPQMKCYALGALEIFDDLYVIDTVTMTIYQPRRENVSTYTMSKVDLYQWADDVLKPTANLAFVGDGNFLCGEWCGFCKAKRECRARAEANMKLARYEFKQPPLLTDEDIDEILGKLDDFISWANDIKDYALQQAISGKEWSGYKLVEGRSNRKYTNEAAAAEAVQQAGFDPYERKVLGVTAMQKLLGKSRFDEILAAYIEKPQGTQLSRTPIEEILISLRWAFSFCPLNSTVHLQWKSEGVPRTGGNTMTNEQRKMIASLRKQGYGYQKIANTIGCSKNTVSSYCRRLDLETTKAPERVCLLCGKPIPEHSRNTRKFCSAGCRKKWNYSCVHIERPYIGYCAACGEKMYMARKNEKKYCSHDCYIKARFGGEHHD